VRLFGVPGKQFIFVPVISNGGILAISCSKDVYISVGIRARLLYLSTLQVAWSRQTATLVIEWQ
jgi:hypothetical protein